MVLNKKINFGSGDCRENQRVTTTGKQIGVLGNVGEVCEALGVFHRVQDLALSRVVVITREPQAMRTAIQLLFPQLELTILDMATFGINSISCVHLVVNLSPTAAPTLFEAAIRAIPVISSRSVYMPPVFVSNESVYEFPHQDLNVLERILRHIAAAPEEADRFAREAEKRTIAWCGRSYLLRENRGPVTDDCISLGRSLVKRTLFALVPRSGLVAMGASWRPEFALTFDDGPHPGSTPRVLRALYRHGVQATFFLVGNRAEQYPDLVKAIFEEGHEIGCHSHTHPYLHRLSLTQAAREIATARRVLEDITGRVCHLFRPPFGNLSVQSLLPAWLQGQCVVMWTVDLKDYRAKDAVEIEKTVAAQHFENGDIILYHDLDGPSIEALPSVLEAAKADGRTGVSVSRMVGLSGYARR
jgi:peptidoglycan/xylan/chitin deacetylase (PgdA/CDA1 family)